MDINYFYRLWIFYSYAVRWIDEKVTILYSLIPLKEKKPIEIGLGKEGTL